VITRIPRWILFSLVTLAGLILASMLAMHLATRSLHSKILATLGPESEIAQLEVGLKQIQIHGLRVKAPKGWPAESTLTAERVVIVPDIRQLFSSSVFVHRVTIENGYLSALRPAQGGGIKVLPGLINKVQTGKAKPDGDGESSGRAAQIQIAELANCVVEIFDATVSSRKKLRLDAVNGTVEDIRVPELDSNAKVALKGTIKGHAHHGSLALAGWVNVAQRSSDLAIQVRNVDLVLFEPYLIRKTKAGVDQGTFNLDIKATTRNNHVVGQGKLLLSDFKVKTGEGAFSSLANIPRRAAIAALADQNDRIELDFRIEGSLDDPNFALDEGLGLRTATALLKGLGMGLEGLLRAFLTLIGGLGSAFG
jgi:hypothetical protein